MIQKYILYIKKYLAIRKQRDNTYFYNKNVWIIGASEGLGEALALELNTQGANITISSRNEEKLQNLLTKLKKTKYKNRNHMMAILDVKIKDSIDKAYKQLNMKWKKIDMIIYSAGVSNCASIENFNLTVSKNIIETNLYGFYNTLDVVLKQFLDQKFGHIAVISSVAGYRGLPTSLAYAPSKAALSNLVEALYLELQPKNINVSLINPGFIKTNMTAKNNFKMLFIGDKTKFAKYSLRKLARNKFEICYPILPTFLAKITKFLPHKLYFKIISFIYKRAKHKS